MSLRYISKDAAPLYHPKTGKKMIELLWGDQVKILEEGPSRVKVQTRGRTGYVSVSAVSDRSLLELSPMILFLNVIAAKRSNSWLGSTTIPSA